MLRDLFEQIRTRYAYAARMGNDLMTRLDAIENERIHWEEALSRPDVTTRARLELNEINQLRPRIDRSARAWVDRARGLELIVAAALLHASGDRPPERVASAADDPRPMLPPAGPPARWLDAGPAAGDADGTWHVRP